MYELQLEMIISKMKQFCTNVLTSTCGKFTIEKCSAQFYFEASPEDWWDWLSPKLERILHTTTDEVHFRLDDYTNLWISPTKIRIVGWRFDIEATP